MTTTPPSTPIFQPSDLNRQGKAVMDAARAHQARIRDKDGSSFVLLPEHRVLDLEAVAEIAGNLATVERARSIRGADALDLSDYGDWTWLEHLDGDDLGEFVNEVRESLIRAIRGTDTSALVRLLAEWRTTANVLADEERREVLLGTPTVGDFIEAPRPEPIEAA